MADYRVREGNIQYEPGPFCSTARKQGNVQASKQANKQQQKSLNDANMSKRHRTQMKEAPVAKAGTM